MPQTALAALDPTTGALTDKVQVAFSRTFNEGRVGVKTFDVSADESTLVAIGNFRRVDGLLRRQVAVVDLAADGAASLNVWSTDRFGDKCGPKFNTFLKDVDIDPTGSYFVIAATGGYFGGVANNVMCDTASRWSLIDPSAAEQPMWLDYTGGDTLSQVEITGPAVYVGGHQRWMNNPYRGPDIAGPGGVDRPGIAALDPRNGLPYSWNPGRRLGVGVFGFLAEDSGLWTLNDTPYFGGERRSRMALTPTLGGSAIPPDNTGVLPGDSFVMSGLGAKARPAKRTFSSPDGSPTSVPFVSQGTPLPWRQVHGAFMADGRIYAGVAGTLRTGTFDGTTFGPRTILDLHGLDAFSTTLQNTTSLFFDRSLGRLYYTTPDSDLLRYRYFTPESGIVGSVPFTVGGTSTVDWSSVRGAFLANGRLYYGSGDDGNLRRVAWTNGAPAKRQPVVVSGPHVDGQHWRSPSLFLLAPAPAG